MTKNSPLENFGSGRQAFLARVHQLMTPRAHAAKKAERDIEPPFPADRPRGFAVAAHRQINGALVRCEERYPNTGPHSVLYVVVERDAPLWRDKLASLHQEYFHAE